MEHIRSWLLEHNKSETYSLVIEFLRSPESISIDEILIGLPEDISCAMGVFLETAMKTYATNKASYAKNYTYGQLIIWKEIYNAYIKLMSYKARVENITLSASLNNYSEAVSELKKLLQTYSEMQVVLSNLEETLGVDRFLDRVSETTFNVFADLLEEVKKGIEDKAKEYKEEFQIQWNSTNVNKVLRHCLINRNDNNQVCEQFSSGMEQSILFLIDGFGYCQYIWNSLIDTNTKSYTFSENIFKWLSDNRHSREMILGSSFITDTGAGLAQIYLGQRSDETGIYASKLRENDSTDVFFETKRIDEKAFNRLFSCRNSITDIVSSLGMDVDLYYCSKYPEVPSGFSKCIFNSADVMQVLPSERVFSILMDEIQDGIESGLQVVYFTGIDNTGHTMGAYSNYERLEHKKIDTLIRNFIIELAYHKPELFDGRRNILVTADHGMFESSKIIVSRKEIREALNNAGINNVKLVENNRAMLFYNEGSEDDNTIKAVLDSFFERKKLIVDVQCKGEKEYSSIFDKDDASVVKPNLVARFVGEGLFYSNPHANQHLLHFGGHGGFSVDEVFIPLIEIPLTEKLYLDVKERFLNIK